MWCHSSYGSFLCHDIIECTRANCAFILYFTVIYFFFIYVKRLYVTQVWAVLFVMQHSYIIIIIIIRSSNTVSVLKQVFLTLILKSRNFYLVWLQ